MTDTAVRGPTGGSCDETVVSGWRVAASSESTRADPGSSVGLYVLGTLPVQVSARPRCAAQGFCRDHRVRTRDPLPLRNR